MWQSLIRYLLLLFVTFVGLQSCDTDNNNYNTSDNYRYVTYEIEDLNQGDIWAEELRYKDEAGIMQTKYNHHVNSSIWTYEAQFKKGRSLKLFYKEQVDASDDPQDYELRIYMDGQLEGKEYLNIQPGQVNSAELEATVD